MTPPSPDRRPIASRERKTSQAVAHWLARRGVAPNMISLAGLVCALIGGAAFGATAVVDGQSWWMRLTFLVAALGMQGRLLANMFDGMVAIETGRASPVGELWNEVPDRISDAAILVGAGYALGGNVVLGFVAMGVALFTAYVRAMGKVAGAHQEFCGPMAKQHRMFVLTVVALYCALTPMSWQPQTRLGGLAALGLAVIVVGGVWTAIRRLMRVAAALKSSTPRV